MDRVRYSLRAFTDSDYGAEARIDGEIDPGFAHTAEEIRHWNEASVTEPGRLNLKLVVEEATSSEVVAYGSLSHVPWSYHPQKFWVSVCVDRAHRSEGIGRELYAHLEKEGLTRSASRLWTSSRDDEPRSLRFLERLGYAPLRKTWLSRLDLAAADLTGLPDRSETLSRHGIRFTTMQGEGMDRPEARERLYELVVLASEDVPRIGEYTPPTFEEFVAFDLDGPGAVPEAMFLACKDTEFVGMSSLEREGSRPDTLRVGFTGTRPQYRGLGIASELKRRAIRYARDLGYRYLVTANDSSNRPIWAINEKLGFRPEVTWVQAEKVLDPRVP
ncbi:MAG: N-acetyltransferase family protein [Thermoplasmata archaeon]